MDGDAAKGLDEADVEGRNAAGTLDIEAASRTDGESEGTISVEHGTAPRLQFSARRTSRRSRHESYEEETRAAQAFADAVNAREGRRYRVCDKTVAEWCDWPDRWLEDDSLLAGHAERRLAVEVTHLDRAFIAALGRDLEHRSEGVIEALAAAALQAMAGKQDVDRAAAARGYLLLVAPFPILELLQGLLADEVAKANPARVYRETWVCPFRTPPFRIW